MQQVAGVKLAIAAMANILNKYQLSFTIKIIDGTKIGISTTSSPVYDPLSNFVTQIYWKSNSESIIEGLNSVLTQQVTEEEFETRDITVVSNLLETDFVYIYNQQGFAAPDLTIPTVDFRDIMVEWKNFLQTMKNNI